MLSHWLISVLLVGLRLISGFRFGMMAVEEFDNVKPAFVDIEMDVPCFKVGRLELSPRLEAGGCAVRASPGRLGSLAQPQRRGTSP